MPHHDWMASHEVLYRQARERIEIAFCKAKRKQIEEPVILVLNLRDKTARQIAYLTGREADVDAQIREADKRGVEPLVLWHIPNEYAKKIAYGSSEVAVALEDDVGPDAFHTVVVADGSVSVYVTPAV